MATDRSRLGSTSLELLPRSLASQDGAEYAVVRVGGTLQLSVLARPSAPVLQRFRGESSDAGTDTLGD